MKKWKYIRALINKNDGALYQINNQILTVYEVIGYLLIIASLVVYLLHDKTGFQDTWLGWSFLFTGALLAVFGVAKKAENDKHT